MLFIQELNEGMKIGGIYLVKSKSAATTKNGKSYENVILMDRTGTVDCKIWEPDSPGIDDFDALDYVDIVGDVSRYNGSLQVSLKRVRVAREGEYNSADYLPTTDKNIDEMYKVLLGFIDKVENKYLNALLRRFLVEDEELVKRFRSASAAKTIHHAFVGGLLQHTVYVTNLCYYFSRTYPILNRDLLLTAAILHDIGKTAEISAFPQNDYTDDGQLLGHIMIGAEMIHDAAKEIEGFPAKLESDLKHCILAHHGEYEYGSPKKPALAEAMALNLADNADARLETLSEIFKANAQRPMDEWLGFNRIFESNIRRTGNIDELK
uniref:3'-5' exoribonuclease YhaM family protein n=1 Tax=Eubacterium cellulosolvens TaxID=29322 RepID=UPI000485ABBC|nr:HD domain-containing protein [[Eubacterium] cellulosolvens]